MGLYTILKNSELEIQLSSDYQDGGWSLVGGNAVHSNLNSGWYRNTAVSPVIGDQYKITFTVSGLESGGSLIVRFGGVENTITENGRYTLNVTAVDTSNLSLYSAFNVTVSPVDIAKGEEPYRTMLYNPRGILDSYISFEPDFMTNLLGSLYSFKNGVVWKHNENSRRNSFYGVDHDSVITFIFNPEPKLIKNLHNIKINGNRCWDLIDIKVESHQGKPNGQKSRLKKNRFENLQGDFHASFLKDMSDPRFQSEMQALFEGADLQGKLVEMKMTVSGGEELKLVNVDITFTPSNYTF